ncbi:glycosyltransferase family 2 protein [Providencia rettgeri]|nr:glycosyltransferase family 2 protein [Providencia sp. PROV230]
MNFNVAIIMSTYNGEKYLDEQIDSILNQSFTNFTLYIRDDGSQDSTVQIIDKYKKIDNRIIFDNKNNNLGPCRSFLELTYQVDADYYIFSDQDDVWKKDKILHMLESMATLDQRLPCLVHSELDIVDKDLRIINNSFYKFSGIQLDIAKNKKQILFQNYVVGCSSCINRKLWEIAKTEKKFWPNIAMHDWWFSIHAIFFGQIKFIPTSDISYRQHSSNVLGAKNNNLYRYIISGITGSGFKRAKIFRQKVYQQVKLFSEKNIENLTTEDKKIINDFEMISDDSNLVSLVNFIYIKKYTLQSKKRNLAFCLSFL